MRAGSIGGTLVLILSSARARGQPHTLDLRTLTPEAAAVYDVWLKYVASKAARQRSTEHWLESEVRQWPVFDLAGFYLLDKSLPNVLRVERVDSDSGPKYRIITRFTSAGGDTSPPSWWAKLTMTVYAVDTPNGWRLANALPVHTARWIRRTVGPITYIHSPEYPFDSTRARRAVAFTDSLAAAFDVPRLAPFTYYLTSTVDEVYRIMGLESQVKFGPVGGAAQPVNRLLFSGIPAIGEEYRHELAHLVLAPLCCARTSYFVSEGVPTWLGGTAGAAYPKAVHNLATYLGANPRVTLDSLMTGSLPAPQMYAAAAVIAHMTFEQRGVAGVKTLFAAGAGHDLRRSLERLLGKSWSLIAVEWHSRVNQIASGATPR